MRIEISVRGSLSGITKLCRVMPKSDPEGWIFLSTPNNHNRFFFLRTLWSPAFDFKVGVSIKQSHWRPPYWKLTSYVTLQWCQLPTLNDTVTWPPIQPMYWQHMLLFIFYPSRKSDKGMQDKVCQHWCKLWQTCPVHKKTCLWHMRTTKEQISLSIHAVSSAPCCSLSR